MVDHFKCTKWNQNGRKSKSPQNSKFEQTCQSRVYGLKIARNANKCGKVLSFYIVLFIFCDFKLKKVKKFINREIMCIDIWCLYGGPGQSAWPRHRFELGTSLLQAQK